MVILLLWHEGGWKNLLGDESAKARNSLPGKVELATKMSASMGSFVTSTQSELASVERVTPLSNLQPRHALKK